ncbi:hypothetical protein J3R30DRAFT_3457866 [Lentinula aciculospora]|uniref:Uncharacterized protein n=1 Tax=Lentinula aciculospora TaxID=153920 RepID=A0A9W9DRG2_9AGAR|nr:hypothetical protein J3R30DRAFT_3457866 [Lentinula aciculospora]
MGDMSMGLAYLCGGCCCFNDTEGSQLSRSRKHPKENDIKNEFMKRDYRRDKGGKIRYNQVISEQPNSQTWMGRNDEPRGTGETTL